MILIKRSHTESHNIYLRTSHFQIWLYIATILLPLLLLIVIIICMRLHVYNSLYLVVYVINDFAADQDSTHAITMRTAAGALISTYYQYPGNEC